MLTPRKNIIRNCALFHARDSELPYAPVLNMGAAQNECEIDLQPPPLGASGYLYAGPPPGMVPYTPQCGFDFTVAVGVVALFQGTLTTPAASKHAA